MNSDELIQQGIELMATEQYDAAASVFAEVVESDKKNADAYVHLGNAYMNLDKIHDGLENYKKALMLRPSDGSIAYGLGCAYFIKNDSLEALKYFNKASDLGFEIADMYGIMATIFIDADDYNQAVRCINRAIAIEPLNPGLRLDKAQMYLNQGKNREAINCLHELQELMPDEGDAYRIEVRVFLGLGDADGALKAADRALDRFPDDPLLLLTKGDALNTAGKFDEALEVLARASENDRGIENISAQIAHQVGIAYAGKGDPAGALDAFEKSHAKNPDNADVLYLLVSTSMALEQWEKALKYSDGLLVMEGAEDRYKGAALFIKAAAKKALGQVEQAQKEFQENVALLRKITLANPGLVDVYAYRILNYKELARYDDALDLAEHLIKLMPEHTSGYAFKADVLAAKGDEDAAEEVRRRVREIDPDFKF